MQNNEYRRALIMLRSLLNGYSGHARVEIRTLMGRLNIRANVPQGAQSVRAALVGRRSALYFAHPLGSLRRDMRGQAGLTVDFDPRNIGGRTLDAYSLLAIVTINDGGCELALVGNLNGSRETDWSRVRSVVCDLFAPGPRPEDLIPAPYAERSDEGRDIASQRDTEVKEGDCCPLEIGSTPEISDESPVEIGSPPDKSGESPVEIGSPPEISGEGLPGNSLEPEKSAPAAPEAPKSEDVPEEFTGFTRIALPDACGYPYAYVGADSLGRICCALPARFTAEPPAGLEEYAWQGGSGAGFWVRCYDPE